MKSDLNESRAADGVRAGERPESEQEFSYCVLHIERSDPRERACALRYTRYSV